MRVSVSTTVMPQMTIPPPPTTTTTTTTTATTTDEADFVAHFASCQLGMVSTDTVWDRWSSPILCDKQTHDTQFHKSPPPQHTQHIAVPIALLHIHTFTHIQAIATLGGTIQHCNSMFCLLAGIPKETILTMTIFALVHQKDLQYAFQCISQMISPGRILQSMLTGASPVSYSFHGSMANPRIGLNVHLVRCGSTGMGRCLAVTLIRDPTSSGSVFSPATPNDIASVLPSK